MRQLRHLLLAAAAVATAALTPVSAGPLPPVMQEGLGTPLVLAQATDPAVFDLQEQVRSLNGKVEELTFQLLQLQEQIRRMQEDNEFRFQELEERRGDAGPAAVDPTDNGQPRDVAAADPAATTDGGRIASPTPDPNAANDSRQLGAPPSTLGTIRFDKDGNVIGGTIVPGTEGTPADGSTVAAIPSGANEDDLYRSGYEQILSGDYSNAETTFREHIARFPASPQAADAQFWLGEAQLGQQKFEQAAETFLNANRNYPGSEKAPESLFKLGVALAGMGNRDLACATFSEVGTRYPGASPALMQRLDQERANAAC